MLEFSNLSFVELVPAFPITSLEYENMSQIIFILHFKTGLISVSLLTLVAMQTYRDYVRGGALGALAPPRNLRVQKGEQKEKQTIHY